MAGWYLGAHSRRAFYLWMYLEIGLALFYFIYMIEVLVAMDPWGVESNTAWDTILFFNIVIIPLITLTMEFGLLIVKLYNDHTKNQKNLGIFYSYSVGMLIFDAVFLLWTLGGEIYVVLFLGPFFRLLLGYLVVFAGIVLLQFLLQVFFVILIRSDMLKLEMETKLQSVIRKSEFEIRTHLTV